MGRLAKRVGEYIELDGHRFYPPPTSCAVVTARLSALAACGLSHAKAQTFCHVAKAIESGELTEDEIAGMSTADALARLTELQGIGAWSAAVVLLRGFGPIDVFPPGDVGTACGLGAVLHLRSPEALDRVVERFGTDPVKFENQAYGNTVIR